MIRKLKEMVKIKRKKKDSLATPHPPMIETGYHCHTRGSIHYPEGENLSPSGLNSFSDDVILQQANPDEEASWNRLLEVRNDPAPLGLMKPRPDADSNRSEPR